MFHVLLNLTLINVRLVTKKLNGKKVRKFLGRFCSIKIFVLGCLGVFFSFVFFRFVWISYFFFFFLGSQTAGWFNFLREQGKMLPSWCLKNIAGKVIFYFILFHFILDVEICCSCFFKNSSSYLLALWGGSSFYMAVCLCLAELAFVFECPNFL